MFISPNTRFASFVSFFFINDPPFFSFSVLHFFENVTLFCAMRQFPTNIALFRLLGNHDRIR